MVHWRRHVRAALPTTSAAAKHSDYSSRDIVPCMVWRIERCLTIALGVLAALAPLFAAHAAENDPSGPKDIQTIIARGTLRIAITKFDLPSFHWRKSDGELAGPEIDLARLIGGLMKVNVEFIDDNATFDGVIDAVASGRADIGISKLSQTPYRLLRTRFSNPYVTLRHAFLFNRTFIGTQAAGQSPEHALRKFSGTLGVIAKSSYVDFAQRNFPNAKISELKSWDEAVKALMDNRVDALYRDEFEVRRLVKKTPALSVRFGSAALTDQKAFLSVAICDTCSRLQEFINYQIAENRVPFLLSGLLATEVGK